MVKRWSGRDAKALGVCGGSGTGWTGELHADIARALPGLADTLRDLKLR
jgi:hypothetical protein